MSKSLLPTVAIGLLMSQTMADPVWQPATVPDTYQNDCCGGVDPRGVSSSPFAPQEASDQIFVNNSGTGLDTGCTFGSAGPLRIRLDITRAIAHALDAEGRLADPSALIAQGVIGPVARLRMPAFDVDSNANIPGSAPEIDKVFFNGVEIGQFSGLNDTWIMQEFVVPIELLRFPAPASGGSLTPRRNEIEIQIDTGNSSNVWCTAVDWVELEIEAQSPMVFVHGIAAQSSTWDAAFAALDQSGSALLRERVNLGDRASVASNGALLFQELFSLRSRWGVDEVHLVAHSKGGLDSRSLLSQYGNVFKPKVRSLFTIASPHRGSVASDFITNYLDHDVLGESVASSIFAYLGTVAYWGGLGPQRPGLDDLRTDRMQAFNLSNPLPPGVRVYSLAADADLNSDGSITGAEREPLFPSVWGVGWLVDSVASLSYSTMGSVASARVEYQLRPRFIQPGLVIWVQTPVSIETPTSSFLRNDLVVTETSAFLPGMFTLFGGIVPGNHSTVKDSSATILAIMNRIRQDFPLD